MSDTKPTTGQTHKEEQAEQTTTSFMTYTHSQNPLPLIPYSINYKDINTASNSAPHSDTPSSSNPQAKTPPSNQLELELEQHFQSLKQEYESKRGQTWTPLQPWTRDHKVWEWECADDDDISSNRTI